MANYASKLIYMIDDQMQNDKHVSMWHIQKMMQMEWHANTHTLSKSNMLTNYYAG